MSEGEVSGDAVTPAPKWKPVPSLERRILGVLAEKAKTTPDAYPLSLNALINGCNQKSNRYPQMNVESIRVENALEKLRAIGAVSEVQGGGRVAKYRHYLYEWLGVSKLESAVMIELLLRGAQTIGELRSRAARMEAIADVASLKPIVQGLIDRGLVISLTPEGRGQVVTHLLYQEEELEKVRRNVAAAAAPANVSGSEAADPPSASSPTSVASPAKPESAPHAGAAAATPRTATQQSPDVAALHREVQSLRSEVAQLRSEIEDIWKNIG